MGVLTSHACLHVQAFGLSSAEAVLMDPQQRLLLQAAATAMSQAGHLNTSASATADGGSMSAYVGVAASDYGMLAKLHTRAGALHATANALSVTAGRLAFVFGMKGKLKLTPWSL